MIKRRLTKASSLEPLPAADATAGGDALSRAAADAKPGRASAALLEVVDLHKRFDHVEVLKGISLSISTGEVVALIGPSGGGKSTFLRCINRIEEPTSGRIYLEGRLVGGAEPDGARAPGSGHELAELRRLVGMVFQSFNLFPNRTILDNIVLGQVRSLGRDRGAAKARAMDLLRQMGIAEKADTYPSRCSGGQQQRAAIARALALDPSLMLFDEPTSSLDPELGYEVLSVMRRLAADGMTMIVATHEMHFAEDVADRVLLMDDGTIAEEGATKQVLREPRTERTKRFLQALRDR
jgi:polar amino acid transport system ATP-binding protein